MLCTGDFFHSRCGSGIVFSKRSNLGATSVLWAATEHDLLGLNLEYLNLNGPWDLLGGLVPSMITRPITGSRLFTFFLQRSTLSSDRW